MTITAIIESTLIQFGIGICTIDFICLWLFFTTTFLQEEQKPIFNTWQYSQLSCLRKAVRQCKS